MKTNIKKALQKRLSIAQRNREEATRIGQDMLTCVVVIGKFNFLDYLICLQRLLAGLDPSERKGWLGNLTKTLFLFGKPQKLDLRHDFRARHGETAITLIRHADKYNPLVRLLAPIDTKPMNVMQRHKAFSREILDARYRTELEAGLFSMSDILIHLNHIVAESVLNNIVPSLDILRIDIAFKENPSLHDGLYIRVVPNASGDGLIQSGGLVELPRKD